MAEGKTSIQVKNETWKRLTMRKEPGDTYDDVVTELLDKVEGVEDKQEKG